MSDFLMPSLGADMESARVVEWMFEPGDHVRAGDIIALIETDKGLIDIEVFENGVIETLIAPLDEELPVGALLATIRTDGESVPERPSSTAPVEAAIAKPAFIEPEALPKAAAPPTLPLEPSSPAIKASPAARRYARDHELRLADLTGTGPQGAITLADVRAPSSPAPVRTRTPGGDSASMRRAIAAAVSRAKREIPHYYLSQPVSLQAALDWLESRNATRTVEQRLLPAVLLLRASALAIARIPNFNGRYENDTFKPADRVHVGWAIALRGGGLVAPAIHDANLGELDDLMAALRDLVKRARSGGLRGSELMDAGLTVTSLGDRGAQGVWPVIYPPQVAMIGFGRVALRPWVVDGKVAACPLVDVSLAADHRVSDGHAGSLLLAEIERLLGSPEQL